MNSAPDMNIVIMAGGTGGHVFPALAVAKVLQERNVHVTWLGTRRGLEARLVPAAGIELHFLSVEGVRGRGMVGLLKAPFLILRALVQSLVVLRRENIHLALGFGGFASGPGGLAARLLRKPLVIHEQNAIPGTTNRLLARRATRVLEAFDDTFALKGVEAEAVGNPVRGDIAALPEPAQRYSARSGPLNLLVLGGSLGARAINECLPAALGLMAPERRPNIWHQTGDSHAAATTALYMQHQVAAKVDAFIEDMAAAYAWADLIVCRAGALTVSEIMAAGVAAILVPFPHAVDDHQTHNARILADSAAAILLPQQQLEPQRLADLLAGEKVQREQLLLLAESARQQAQPRSAERVADICQEVIRG